MICQPEGTFKIKHNFEQKELSKVFATFLEATRMLRQHAVLLLVFKFAIKLPKFC